MLEAKKLTEELIISNEELNRVSEEAYRRVRAAAAAGELAEDSPLSRVFTDKSVEEILDELEEESERNGDAFEEMSHEEVFGSAWELVNGHGL